MRRVLAPSLALAVLVAARYLAAAFAAGWAPSLLGGRIAPSQVFDTLIWLCLAWFAKRAIEAIFRRPRPGRGDEERTPTLAFDILGLIFFLLAIIAIVGLVFRQPVTGLLATSGLVTAVIALAVRDLIADIFAGIALAVERPIRIGDWIQFDEATPQKTGRVIEMNWRAVRMVTVQGRMLVFPNNALSRREFVNLSQPARFFRTAKKITVDFSVPPARAGDIIMAAIRATPGVVQSQKPLVLIDELSERGTVFSFHFWVPDYAEMFMIERRVVENVLHFLDKAGYAPAYPKLEADIDWRNAREINATMDLPDLLHRVPLFSELSEDERACLAGYSTEVRAAAGETLVAEGESGDSLFVVLTGLMAAHKTVEGKPHRIGQIEPGQVFGEMSLLTGTPRSATVTAEVDSVLLKIEREALQRIIDDNPGIVEQLGRIQASRMSAQEVGTGAADGDALGEQGLAAYLVKRIWKVFGEPG